MATSEPAPASLPERAAARVQPDGLTDGSASGSAGRWRPTARSLPIALLRARENVMGPIREMLGPSGVSEQKWRLLRVLAERGPLDLTTLAAEACLLLPSLTRMVRPLEQAGLIRRETPQADRRRVVVSITAAGTALLDAHAAESAAIFARIEARFGADRLNRLLDLLQALEAVELQERVSKGAAGEPQAPDRGNSPNPNPNPNRG